MKGDYSRITFDPKKHYSSVRMQQGRVQTDADWNEQIDIMKYRMETEIKDFIGQSGAPDDNQGFDINISGSDLSISKGRYYVEGMLIENEEERKYTNQPDLQGLSMPDDKGLYLAYMDVWQRHMTALEAPDIRDAALGDIDTAARIKNIWQVKLLKLTDDENGEVNYEDFKASSGAGALWEPKKSAISEEPRISSGKLKAKVNASNPVLENQLYRVEIHSPGAPGTAKFKWSRENGSIAASVVAIGNDIVDIRYLGRGLEDGFEAGDWIEISDEYLDLEGKAGALVQLKQVQDTKLFFMEETITDKDVWNRINGDYTNGKGKVKINVRRWDSYGLTAVPSAGDAWLVLEDDIEVCFSVENEAYYKSGDYWMIPSRALTGDIYWERDADGKPLFRSPRGIRHYYTCLAILSRSDAGVWSKKEDLRERFKSLVKGLVNKAGDTMTGDLALEKNLRVMGAVVGNLNLENDLTVKGSLTVTGDVIAKDTEHMKGDVNLGDEDKDTITVFGKIKSGHSSGALKIEDSLSVTENFSVGGTVKGSGNAGALRIDMGNGYVDIGPMNTSWSHFQTDREKFYFNKEICVDSGFIGSYDEDLRLRTSRTDRITVKNDTGNVGIGTDAPSERLDVSDGSIQAAGVRKMKLTRDITDAPAGSYADIGSIRRTDNLPVYAKIKIWTHHSSALMFNEYEVSEVYYAGADTDWIEVPPKSVRSWADDGRKVITVDARFKTNNAELELRLRRTEASGGAGQVYVELETNGTFTKSPDNAKGTGAAVKNGYLGQSGWYFPTTPNRFQAATEGLFITPGGNVGIGTDGPSAKLEVNGTIQTDYLIVDPQDSNGEGGEIQLKGTGGYGNIQIDNYYGNCRIHSLAADKVFEVYGGGLHIHKNIRCDGSVGIGTASPSQKLEIVGSHGDTLFALRSTGDGGSNPAYLNMWASEPGWTYDGVGIGQNIANSPYYGRVNKDKGASFIRFIQDDIEFGTIDASGTTKRNVMYIDGANVGIGTDAPSAKLDVNGSALLGYAGYPDDFDFNKPLKSGCYQAYTNEDKKIIGDIPDKSHPWMHLFNLRHSNTGNLHELQIASSYAENNRLFFRKIARGLDDSGRPGWNEIVSANEAGSVGIGTASPSQKLEIVGSHGDTLFALRSTGDGGSNPAYLNMWASEPGWTYDGVGIGQNIANSPYYGRVNKDKGASFIRFIQDDIEFGTIDASGTTKRNVMYIDGTNVGIGTTAPSQKLHVVGNVRIQGHVDSDGCNRSYSDLRLKKNIASIENSLEKIIKLRGVFFEWKDETKGKDKNIGMIAQEVEKILPELVSTDEEGYKSIGYANLTAVLVEAVKELEKRLNALEKRN